MSHCYSSLSKGKDQLVLIHTNSAKHPDLLLDLTVSSEEDSIERLSEFVTVLYEGTLREH